MLSGRPGRLHMLFSPSFWFRGSFVSVLWGGHRLRCLGCPLLVILWLQHAFLFFRWLFFHILCLRCWPGWFLFHLSIFPFFLCLCIALGFLLLASWGGMFSALWILLKILHSMCLVSWSASMNTSFGILSGPRLFFLFSLLMALFISFGVMGSSPCSGFVLLFLTACSTATLISSVDLWYSGSPSLAWYRFWKYSATYSRVSSGSVKVMLSSVIVLYSMLLVACAFLCLRL